LSRATIRERLRSFWWRGGCKVEEEVVKLYDGTECIYV
jgi:hypothetical protein